MTEDDDITITAEGAKVMASEKVSTGDYENAQISQTVEVSIEGADLTDGVPKELQQKLYALKKTVQGNVESAAEERQKISPAEQAEMER